MHTKILVRLLMGAIILFSIALGSPKTASACSCVAFPSIEKQVNEAQERMSAIFSGQVIEIAKPRLKFHTSSVEPVKVTFEVSRVWKGELGRKASVYTAYSSASCGYEFQVGTEYLVSANMGSEPLVTSICSLTKPISLAKTEISLLGTGYAPDESLQEQSSPSRWIYLGAAIVVIGGTAGWLFIRRRKPGS